ncbi:MAG: sortase [Eubacterium sp.]|nr:sortase [Eubacterium sp.]
MRRRGDTFSIHVLGEVITYQADQTAVVLPHEIQDLAITEHADYCTLVTCTPPGIDTHRLLVRGRRIYSDQS